MPISIAVTSAPPNNSANPVIYHYTSSATWNKPSDSSFYGVIVLCAGAGSGGGGGRQGANLTFRGAGTGGQGGSLGTLFIPASNLSQSYQITVGAGSTGGLGATTIDTNGGSASGGGSTRFGNQLVAPGGQSAIGGSNISNLGGGYFGTQYTGSTPSFGYHIYGGVGGNVSTSTAGGQPGDIGGSIYFFGAGGGSGTSIRSTNNTIGAGGAGGAFYYSGSSGLFQGDFVQANGGTVGVFGSIGSNGTNIPLIPLPTYTFGLVNVIMYIGGGGGGGRCGDLSGSIAAGNGGSGAGCAGGGGGGGSTNGANAGNGGSGGNGFCIVVELYGN